MITTEITQEKIQEIIKMLKDFLNEKENIQNLVFKKYKLVEKVNYFLSATPEEQKKELDMGFLVHFYEIYSRKGGTIDSKMKRIENSKFN